MKNEEGFEKWMRETKGRRDSTIYMYVNALKNRLSDMARALGLIDGSLFDVGEKVKFDSVRKQLEKDADFISLNESGHKLLSNALGRYADYLEQKKS